MFSRHILTTLGSELKFKFKFNRRHNTYITLVACGFGVMLMVTNFGLSVSKLLSFTLIAIVFLAVIIGAAALTAMFIRYFSGRD